jgi:hypothetical protein
MQSVGSVDYLSGEEATGQCRPNSGPDGIFLVDRRVLLFWTLAVKHAIYQSERWMCSFFVNSLVLTLLSNRRDQVKPVSDIWVSYQSQII